MSLIDMPTSREYPASMQQVIPSDSRNFSRSDRDWAVPYPQDSNLAKDDMTNQFTKNVQKFMKTTPLGVAYSGPVDGKISPELTTALQRFQIRLQNKTNEIMPPIAGGSLNQGAVRKTFQIYQEYARDQVSENKSTTYIANRHKNIKEKPDFKTEISDLEQKLNPNEIVKAYQSYLSKTLPLVGKTYSGPVDGQINDNLITAAKQVESTIASYINNQAVNGVIWNANDKTFNTSPADIQEALNLIVENNSNQKVGKTRSEERILTFSSFLSRKTY